MANEPKKIGLTEYLTANPQSETVLELLKPFSSDKKPESEWSELILSLTTPSVPEAPVIALSEFLFAHPQDATRAAILSASHGFDKRTEADWLELAANLFNREVTA